MMHAAKIPLVLLLGLSSLSANAAPLHSNSSNSDPVLSPEQLKAPILKEYRKDEAKKLANDLLFLRGRRASDVKKYFGDTGGEAAAPPANAGSGSSSPGIPPAAQNPYGFTPHLFVRRDRLDTFQLREAEVPVSNAKGAAVSFTQDELANSTNFTVNGRIQYLMVGYDGLTPCNNGAVANPYAPSDPFASHVGYAIAPFVDAQGTINSPAKKTDTNNLQTGVDFQVSILGGQFFDHHYIIFTPYYQTDFNGIANVEGIRAAWEPLASAIHLGGYVGESNPYVDWYWQIRAELDQKHVTAVGSTGLTKGDYTWVGDTAQLHIRLFPDLKDIGIFWQSPVPALVNRLYSNVSYSSYWNATTGKTVGMFEAELGYNLTTDGKSSISFRYDNGTDKDTVLSAKKYLATLNYKN